MRISDCDFDDDVLYHVGSNTWVRISEGVATIGLNTVTAWAFGVFSSVTFKKPGAKIARGEGLGSIEGPRHFDVVRSPLSGELLEANQELLRVPKLLNKDPYGEGWFARVRPTRLDEESGGLLPADSAARELEKALVEMKVRCFREFPDLEMHEIGTECSAVLARLDELIEQEPRGTVVHIVSDDPTAGIEMIRWTERTGNSLVDERREGNLEHFIIKKNRK